MKKWFRRILLVTLALSIIGGLCLAYGYFIEPTRLVINKQNIAIKGWDPAFDGLKFVAIGDIHGGSNHVDDARLRELVLKANAENPDVIVLLGDFVAGRPSVMPPLDSDMKMPMAEIADGLVGFQAKYGVFAVLGNHDGWWGNNRVESELERVGIRVLENEVAVVEKDGHRFRLLGLKDILQLPAHWDQTSTLGKRLLDETGGGDVIVLEHHPDVTKMITGDLSISPDLKLILAAHTHGGQVWLPIIGTPIVPSTFGQQYSYGHVVDNNVDIFVTSGVGTSILPIRFMMPPEIAVLTISASP